MSPAGPRLEAKIGAADRRLVAVAFIDIAGYTLLTAADEVGTHAGWMSLLNTVVRPLATLHQGRVVKSTGDGVLVEFPSVLNAITWATGVQTQRSGDAADRPLTLRISVHLGEVVTTDDDIYGDGVNVAARLQEHATPGGIVLSAAAREMVRGFASLPLRDLGLVTLRNMDRSIHAYALDPAGPVTAPGAGARAAVLPSIAVLPLRTISDDPSDFYVGDGIVEDIIVSLSALRELTVISRTSTLAFARREADVREIGRALGVRYVATGSIQRAREEVRISVQLAEAETGAVLWADRIRVSLADLFDTQDDLVARIVGGIAPQIRAEELRRAMRRRPENLTAYDHALLGLHRMDSLDRATFGAAIDSLEAAMRADSTFAMPIAWAVWWHVIALGQGWADVPEKHAEQATKLAGSAVALDPANSLALAMQGHLRSYVFHDYDAAVQYFDRALIVGPNNAVAWMMSALTLAYIGRGQDAIRHAERAMKLSPLDRRRFLLQNVMAWSHYSAGSYDDAITWARLSAGENPMLTANLRVLTAALVAAGREEEAREAARQLMALEPQFSLNRYERTLQPFRDDAIKGRFIAQLGKSGLPS
jgi:adenylate cyclase